MFRAERVCNASFGTGKCSVWIARSPYLPVIKLVDGSPEPGKEEVIPSSSLEGSDYRCQPERMGCHSGICHGIGDMGRGPLRKGCYTSTFWSFGPFDCHKVIGQTSCRIFQVRVQSNNATAYILILMAYINHQGGTRSQAAQKKVNHIPTWVERHVPVSCRVRSLFG